jgi:CRISPR/Cas system CMR-associated protein Cmr1 (group 7 of RAMP superfamily)
MATMKDVFGSIDFASGFAMDVSVDTGSDNDAKELVGKVNAQLAETRKNPQVMLMGLSTVLDGVKIDSKGPTFHLTVNYNQQQVDDLVNRIKGLLSSFGNALGGGAGGLPKGP